MFTLPPKPPKDYYLKDVIDNQISSDVHTPSAYPRATSTSIGKYCYPIPANDDEPFDKSTVQELGDSVLNNWTKQAKALWVDSPGENAYYLHDIYKKYYVVVDPDYDPRYKHSPKVFQRSYKYELDSLEYVRSLKLQNKMQREEEIDKALIAANLNVAIPEDEKVVGCKIQPPFWWRQSTEQDSKICSNIEELEVQPSKSTYQDSYRRWQRKPNPIQTGHDDYCKRRDDLFKVGQPFKHEACTWYFKNYPPPDIKFVPEKFAK